LSAYLQGTIVSKARLGFLVAACLYRLSLELSYVLFISEWFEYAGFSLYFTGTKYAESWVIYAVLLGFSQVHVRKPSDFLAALGLFFYVTPLLVFYSLADRERWMLYAVLAQFIFVLLTVRLVTIRFRGKKYGGVISKVLAWTSIAVATAWILRLGIAHFSLDFNTVYDRREFANLGMYEGAMGYVVGWATSVAGVFLLLLGLRDRNFALVLAIIILHVLWFGLTSHKSIFFYPILALMAFLFLRRNPATTMLPVFLAVVVSFSLAHYLVTKELSLGDTLTRRIFFVPSYLTFVYVDFFDLHPKIFWSNSVFAAFIENPYDKHIPVVIGEYLGDFTVWANNSFYSMGYAHAGMFGILVYAIIAGVLIRIVDAIADAGVPLWLAGGAVTIPFQTLFTSSDLPTTFFTHGLGFAILLLWLLGGETKATTPN
jgi:hypothetical protein